MFHPNGAPLADADLLLGEVGQLRHVERAHRGEVLCDTVPPKAIGLAQHLVHERLPRRDAREIAAIPEQQRLVEPPLERTVAGLDVTILLLRADLGRPRLHPEVPHHREVVVVEWPLAAGVGQDELAVRNAVRSRR